MGHPIVFLSLLTAVLWSTAIYLYQLRKRFTLVPLYCYIAVLTLLTHNLSDLGFSTTYGGWFFFISSTSFFTSLLLSTFFIYLFEGPRATRLAIQIILATSILYIFCVAILSLIVDTSSWVSFTPDRLRNYFWSISAITVDVFLMAIIWETLSKKLRIPQMVKIFIVFFFVYSIDTIIYSTGTFLGQPIFPSILISNISLRFILSAIMSPIISLFLNAGKYSESTRAKPKYLWEILNFKSDLETEVQSLEEAIRQKEIFEKSLAEQKELYELVVEGSGAGIWIWNTTNDKVTFSKKFCQLLGYSENELSPTLSTFKGLFESNTVETFFQDTSYFAQSGTPFSSEIKLRNKDGNFIWFSCRSISKHGQHHDPSTIVGSIIDINKEKEYLQASIDKNTQLERSIKLMVDRELEMVNLKKQLQSTSNISPLHH